MSVDQTGGSDQGLEKYRSFILGQLRSGVEASKIAERLVEMGVSTNDASQMVLTVQGETAVSAGGEALVSTAVPMAIIGGAVGAAAGAAVWAVVALVTGYNVGWIAWLVGVLSAGGVLLLTGGKKGVPYQLIAVVCSVIGVFVGQYSSVYFEAKAELAKAGMERLLPSFFSGDMFRLFVEFYKENFSPIQILFVLLAIGSAWGILNPNKQQG